jgi:hypothetical protein
MPSQLVVPFLFVLFAIITVLTNPLTSIGNSYGPGWADVLNGGAAMLLILLAGISALVARIRAGRKR